MIAPHFDIAQEQRYRSHFLRRDAVSFSLLAGLVLLFNLLLFKADARFWPNGPVHQALVALRIFIILGSGAAIFFSLRTKEIVIFDRWAVGWGMLLALTNIPVILSRPATYTGNIVPELLAVVCLFAVMPDRRLYRLTPPISFAFGSLILLLTVKQLPEPVALLSILISYLTAIVMGYRISKAFFSYRREAFLAAEELAEAHRQAYESEQLYRLLVQHSHGIIYSIRPDGCMGFVSPSWTRLLGQPVDQVVGKDFRTFVHQDDVPGCEAFLQKTVETGEVQQGVLYRVFHADGTMRWHRSNIVPCFNEKREIISFVGNAVDETEQVLREEELRQARHEAEAASRAKTEFLALVSHEIRTPLNALVGFSTLARKSHDPDKITRYLSILEESSHSLMELVNDILDMSKIEAERMTLEAALFNLNQLLGSLEGQYRQIAEQKGLAFQMALSDGLPEWVLGDQLRIRQILANLLSNAVKFTRQGEVCFTVTAESPHASDAVVLRVEVRDSGIGIPEGKISQLFQPFHQFDPGISREFGGTGLGLAIVQNLVRLIGGRIAVESGDGAGSCFTVLLPVTKASPPVSSQPPDPSVATLGVLVVEDNEFSRLLLRDILVSLGHQVTVSDNGLKALQILEQQRFDLILLDIRMPGIDGVELTRRLRDDEQQQDVRAVPIIAITADADTATRDACLAVGINRVLAKPIASETLAKTIADLCGIGMPLTVSKEPLLNARTLAGLGTDPERYRQYRAMLTQDIRENLQRLQSACSHDDQEELVRSAHTLKGLYAQFENPEPLKLAAWLQHNAATASPVEKQHTIATLQAIFLQDQARIDKEEAR